MLVLRTHVDDILLLIIYFRTRILVRTRRVVIVRRRTVRRYHHKLSTHLSRTTNRPSTFQVRFVLFAIWTRTLYIIFYVLIKLF